MCRKSKTCPYVRPNDIPVGSPAVRPEVFDSYLSEFAKAAHEAIGSRTRQSVLLLAWTKERELNKWFTDHAQLASTFRKNVTTHQKPAGVVKDETPLTASCIKSVNQRDNYRCRYCGNPVLPASFFKKLTNIVGSDQFRSVGTNTERHGIKLVFSATADHLVPRADGGRTDMHNLVTSCWPCNYGKANFTLDELGMTAPLDSHPHPMDERVAKLLAALDRQ